VMRPLSIAHKGRTAATRAGIDKYYVSSNSTFQ